MDTGGSSKQSSHEQPQRMAKASQIAGSPSNGSSGDAPAKAVTPAIRLGYASQLPPLPSAAVAPAVFPTKTTQRGNLPSPLGFGFSSAEADEDGSSDAATTSLEPVRDTNSPSDTIPQPKSGSEKPTLAVQDGPRDDKPLGSPSASLRALAHSNAWRRTASPSQASQSSTTTTATTTTAGSETTDPTRLQPVAHPPANADIFLASAHSIARAHGLADPDALVAFLNAPAQRRLLQDMVRDMVVDSVPDLCHSDFSGVRYWLVAGREAPTDGDLRGSSRRVATLVSAVYGLADRAGGEGGGTGGMVGDWGRQRILLMFVDVVIAYSKAWFTRPGGDSSGWTNWDLVARMREWFR
ncbi:hypothetical protein MFIFM68171_07371 [Madurella fahalii]|uniref:Uncharacterized protein n=1 Tax=Madurella fahalii TaxID=1157608 RepID=A0ABQ0GHC4_9PEZI